MKIADYWEKEGEIIHCKLCPFHCRIKEGSVGNCKVRKNVGGKLYSLFYGKPSSVSVDPIEKKPLYHFKPGSRVLSIATPGCNLHCRFCQNWRISQETDINTMDLPPKKVLERASDCDGIAYTYTEPTIFYEYARDTAKLANKKGLFNVFVTNGVIEEKPLLEISEHVQAVNIDLKSFDNSFYQKICEGKLDWVLESIKKYKESGVWVELTNLIVPGENDDPHLIKKMCEWIVENVGNDVPVHFTQYWPQYEMDKPPTSTEQVKTAKRIAEKSGIKFVYAGRDNHTECPSCGETLIKRSGFRVVKNVIEDGKCPKCDTKIPGIF